MSAIYAKEYTSAFLRILTEIKRNISAVSQLSCVFSEGERRITPFMYLEPSVSSNMHDRLYVNSRMSKRGWWVDGIALTSHFT